MNSLHIPFRPIQECFCWEAWYTAPLLPLDSWSPAFAKHSLHNVTSPLDHSYIAFLNPVTMTNNQTNSQYSLGIYPKASLSQYALNSSLIYEEVKQLVQVMMKLMSFENSFSKSTTGMGWKTLTMETRGGNEDSFL